MNLERVISSLTATGGAITTLCTGFSSEEAAWRPGPGKWSLVEVVNHLLDEERLDFRARISSLIDDPSREWDRIDPEGWVTERNYRDRNLEETLRELSTERVRSLEMIREWREIDWSIEKVHPQLGPLSAGDLLFSWMTHDLLHIRQILRVRYELSARNTMPAAPAAMDWRYHQRSGPVRIGP